MFCFFGFNNSNDSTVYYSRDLNYTNDFAAKKNQPPPRGRFTPGFINKFPLKRHPGNGLREWPQHIPVKQNTMIQAMRGVSLLGQPNKLDAHKDGTQYYRGYF